jgi:isocitrate dehydrogenase
VAAGKHARRKAAWSAENQDRAAFFIAETGMQTQTIHYIEGDGIGPEVMSAAQAVLDASVRAAYPDRRIEWLEVLAGEKAYAQTGSPLPQDSLDILRDQAEVGLKGPLGTPVAAGFRSLNVTLRQTFDLYACIRPIRHFPGIESPLKRPQDVDMVVFRENTEDVYAGIEWPAGSPEAGQLIEYLRDQLGVGLAEEAAIGLKPVTETGCKRLVRRAIDFALAKDRRSVTLVHKGNIMKFTEGAFRNWGYEVAREEFPELCVTESEQVQADGRLPIKDRIADNMFQQALLAPEEYDVLATTNLNGDYLSDALAAQVGGLGIAPGANIGDRLAMFEATHGTAPDLAGQDAANPCSLILSGAMLFEHIGWQEAAERLFSAVSASIASKRVTGDLARMMAGAEPVGCREFGDIVVSHLG